MNLFDRIDAAAKAAAELERLMPVTVQEVLKLHRNRVVFRVMTDDGPAVVKRLLGPNAGTEIAAMQAELAYIAPRMNGEFRVARCIGALPKAGVIVLEQAPGKPLTEALSGPHRAMLMQQARLWLAAYTRPRREIASFAPALWVTLAASRTVKTGENAQISAALAKLRDLARHRGAPMAKAYTHGDFVAANLLADRDVLWGVDIAGGRPLPLAKEAARFLVWARMGERLPPSAQDHRSFGPEALLEPGEGESTLPFFTGFEIIMRMIDVADRPQHLPPLRTLLAEWLG